MYGIDRTPARRLPHASRKAGVIGVLARARLPTIGSREIGAQCTAFTVHIKMDLTPSMCSLANGYHRPSGGGVGHISALTVRLHGILPCDCTDYFHDIVEPSILPCTTYTHRLREPPKPIGRRAGAAKSIPPAPPSPNACTRGGRSWLPTPAQLSPAPPIPPGTRPEGIGQMYQISLQY